MSCTYFDGLHMVETKTYFYCNACQQKFDAPKVTEYYGEYGHKSQPDTCACPVCGAEDDYFEAEDCCRCKEPVDVETGAYINGTLEEEGREQDARLCYKCKKELLELHDGILRQHMTAEDLHFTNMVFWDMAEQGDEVHIRC